MRAIVEKRRHDGRLAIRYEGELLGHDQDRTTLSAHFTVDLPRPYVHFRRGDRTVETFYHDRWYHIVELHDVDDDRLKGWYCNVTRPPAVSQTVTGVLIVYDDLALDVFVSPGGELLVLDEDELHALQLDAETLAQAWTAVKLLREQAEQREAPFDQIKG